MDLILTPEYGRHHFISKKEVLASWDKNHDFKILTPKYSGFRRLNKADFIKYRDELMPDVTAIKFRYNNMQDSFYLEEN